MPIHAPPRQTKEKTETDLSGDHPNELPEQKEQSSAGITAEPCHSEKHDRAETHPNQLDHQEEDLAQSRSNMVR